MKPKAYVRNAVFCMLLVLFAALVAAIVTRAIQHHLTAVIWLMLAFGVTGALLVILTVRVKERRTRKVMLLLAGGSAVGIPLCIVAHNLLYAVVIKLFGEDVWGPGGDEPVFFVLAVLVLPTVFVVSAIAGIVLLLMKGKR